MALDDAFVRSLGCIHLPQRTPTLELLREDMDDDLPQLTDAELGEVFHIASLRSSFGGRIVDPYSSYVRPTVHTRRCPIIPSNTFCWCDNVLRAMPDSRVDKMGYPINPQESLPIADLYLPQWGPNHIANPVVTCICREVTYTHLYLLVCDRKDLNHVSLPEGLVDPGESCISTIMRELDRDSAASIREHLSNAPILYAGYVRSVLNTRHAWQETLVKHVHLQHMEASRIQFSGESLRWMRLTRLTMKMMHASHATFVAMAVAKMFD